MPVKIWIGDECEHTQEAEALSFFIGHMKDAFDADERDYHILVNFAVNGSPVDAAVIKSDSLMLIELKQVGGKVEGGENGAWYVTGDDGRVALRGGSHGNPYRQIRSYRFALIEILNSRAQDFLENRTEIPAFHKTITGMVVFSPQMDPATNISVGQRNVWFKCSGLPQLTEKVAHITTPGFHLTSGEMNALISEVLGLEEARLIGNTPRRPVVARPIPVPEAEQPVSSGATQLSGDTEMDRVQDFLQQYDFSPAETAPAEPPECVICALGAHPCDKKYIRGYVRDMDVRVSPPVLMVDIEDKDNSSEEPTHGAGKDVVSIALHVPADPTHSNNFDADLKFIRDRLDRGRRVVAAFMHLKSGDGLVMTAESVMLLEPDWLINVTDMAQVVYCPRKLLMRRFDADSPGEPAILGNAIHQAFLDIWRAAPEEDISKTKEKVAKTIETAIRGQAVALVSSSTVPKDVQEASEPHVERLINFASNQGRTSTFRNETFVLAPMLGLKGRIDAVWERGGRPVIVCDLKTGKTYQGEPREEHLLQVLAYAFMLVARGENEPSKLCAILIYSGDANNLLHRVGLSTAWFRKVVDARNLLVRMEVTSEASHATSIRRCYPCTSKFACRHIGLLCDHSDSRPIAQVRAMLPTGDPEVNEGAKAFFNHYADLLAEEFAAAKTAHAILWAKSSKERCETGKSLYLDAERMPEAKLHSEDGYYVYDLYTPDAQINTSVLRAGDAVILSGAEGPKSGRTTIATVMESRVNGLQVRTREEMLLCPSWADIYTDEGLAARMFSGLYRFVASNTKLLALLLEDKKIPTFTRPLNSELFDAAIGHQGDIPLNEQQILAVERSLMADTCLLVNGPPGAGKTSLIAAMVSIHLKEGSRILIATTTNRALDQALGKVATRVGTANWMRLGSALSASDEAMKSNTVAEIVERGGLSAAQRALLERPVVGTTISTLLSGSYDEALGCFDLVIVDEATQSTIPATLGAVSFGKRFVLIGDPNQLPPIAQAGDAIVDEGIAGAEMPEWPGLNVSLFEHIASKYKQSQPDVIVDLVQQYRMNDVICSIPSQMWYEPDLKLVPADVDNAHGTKIAVARLTCSDSWKSLPMGHLLDPERPFVFVDVELPPAGPPRVNENEANLVAELLSSLLRVGDIISPFDKSERSGREISIAVISPYRAQVARIRSMVANEHQQHVELWRDSIDTVDRFQGSEADFVVISLSPYVGNADSTVVSEHIANARRLNVAMTRARHKLIMLGNRDYLAASPLFQKLFKVAEKTLGDDRWIHRHYENVIQ